MTGAVSDGELLAALRASGEDEVAGLSRRPYRYATSAPLEEVRVCTGEGEEFALILKDLTRERLLAGARASKPEHLHQPLRELDTYRRILAPEGIGPHCFAAVVEEDPPRHWLLIEKVPGVELWQIGELEVWEGAAVWLGGFHARFASRLEEVHAANPHLLVHSEEWYRSWYERARTALSSSHDERAAALMEALAGYDEVAAGLAKLPRTFIHGEFYPSNVLVVAGADPPGIYPVDWEMAALGPGTVDLAALVSGWEPPMRRRLVDAYLGGLAANGPGDAAPDALGEALSWARLHLAMQWLGWASDWQPPREHAHDWVDEALALVRELGLG